MRGALIIWAIAASYSVSAAPVLADTSASSTPGDTHFTPVQLFAFADSARDRGDFATAEAAYRALAADPNLQLRSEARFRLALMLANQLHKLRDGAIELRKILDENPKAARVRLELARIDALLGHVNAAGRELRAAQAAGLPPDVATAVRFYAQALDARRPVGGSLEVALAPDSNVNRATASSTLGTVIGNFTLSKDAQVRSGLGASVRGQGFARLPVAGKVNLIGRLSGSANIYRSTEFDDLIVAPQLGPEVMLGQGRLSLAAGLAWRWYGAVPYTLALTASADWLHPLGKRAQVRLGAGYASIDNRRNDLESGNAWSLSAGVDRAFSARFGGGLQVSGSRQTAKDAGYATVGGGINAYVFREIGKTTIALNASYSHLEADNRLFLFVDRRIDNNYSIGLNGTFRQIRVGAIVPIVRFRFERNASTVQLYDYRRFAGEIGVATAF
nr:surface lipoprotein assembly modifier [Novosphingobium sp. SG707]